MAKAQTMTKAQTIAARFGDDGLQWTDTDGVALGDAVRAAGAVKAPRCYDSPSLGGGSTRDELWVFSDGSALYFTPEAWDVMEQDPDDETHWYTAGHPPGAGWETYAPVE